MIGHQRENFVGSSQERGASGAGKGRIAISRDFEQREVGFSDMRKVSGRFSMKYDFTNRCKGAKKKPQNFKEKENTLKSTSIVAVRVHIHIIKSRPIVFVIAVTTIKIYLLFFVLF
jgi:hypothetical protein